MQSPYVTLAIVVALGGSAPATPSAHPRKAPKEIITGATAIRINATELGPGGKRNRRIVDVRSASEVAAIIDAFGAATATDDAPDCRVAFALEFENLRGKPIARIELCDDGVAGNLSASADHGGLRVANVARLHTAFDAVGVAFPLTRVITEEDLVGTWTGKVATTMRTPADHVAHTPASEHTDTRQTKLVIVRRGDRLYASWDGAESRPLQLTRDHGALVDHGQDDLEPTRYSLHGDELRFETEIKGHFGGTAVGLLQRKPS